LSAQPTDEQLVAAFVAGDSAAYDELVRRYRRRVFGICLQYFHDAAEAEDAAQDAFVALLRKASTFAGTAAFSTWMYRVTTNACNDIARKRARRPRTTGDDFERLGETPDMTDLLATRELGVELEQALAKLDPEFRQVILLHDVAGLPYADIGDRLGLAVGTVKSRIHRGHARLAVALGHLREPNRPIAPPTVQP
jgi:RNA polymerase sigma-70 factor (ECF subfamily)